MSNFKDLLTSVRSHPRYTLMRGVARFRYSRALVAGCCRLADGPRLSRFLAECEANMGGSSLPDVDREAFVALLRRDGVARGLRLPERTVKEIVAHAMESPVFADRKPQFGFKLEDRALAERRLGKPILVAQYFNTEIHSAAVRELVADPTLQWIAARYLECVPTFVGTNLWWTFPVRPLEEDRDRHAHLYHRDVDDFRFFKFFFYLTPVQPGDGAHVCVVASHVSPPRNEFGDPWILRRYADTEIQRTFPRENVLEICGAAGTGFAENTLCVHKGLTPTDQPRLLLQIQFALFDYGVAHDRRDPGSLQMFC